MALLTPFELREAQDASDEKLLSDVANHGWHIVQIFAEDGLPPFAFTVGLYYQFLQPEVLIMGIDLEVSAAILNDIGEAMRTGRTMSLGRYPDFIDGFDVELAPIDPSHYKEYLGYASWFYRSLPQSFPAVQCLWPDRSGLFPYEAGFNASFSKLQCLLTSPA